MSFDGDLTKYEGDFLHLKEMKDLLIEELLRMKDGEGDPTFSDSELKSGIYTELADGREVRVVLPGGLRTALDYLEASLQLPVDSDRILPNGDSDILKKKKEICFVGFVGHKSEYAKTNEEILRQVNNTDSSMLKELPEVDGMIAYVSGERAKRGDYSNLVLFRERAVLQDLFKSKNHANAISSLSPKFYSEVRIHSGVLPDGLTSSFFLLQKTLFLQYTLPPEDAGRRRVQMWRASREESGVVKVRPRSIAAWRC